MRSILLIGCLTCIWAQTPPPLARILQNRPQPATANGTQDLQQFRSAVNNSRPVFQRGGARAVNQYQPLFGDAYSYLGGLEPGATNPVRRQQLAYAYQDLGDLLGNPNGYNVGQQALAIQCYQRAAFLLGAVGYGGQGMYGAAGLGGGGFDPRTNRDLETLATRLTLLNAPYMLFNQAGLFGQQQPAEPKRAPIEVKPTPGIAMPPTSKTGEAAEAADVREAYVAASGRAQALIANVDELRASLGAQGLTLHPDIAGSMTRMRLYFELAADSMASGAWPDARRQIEKGQYEAGKLAKHIGH